MFTKRKASALLLTALCLSVGCLLAGCAAPSPESSVSVFSAPAAETEATSVPDAPSASVSGESVSEEPVSEESVPDESVPGESVPEESVPGESVPENPLPEAPVPDVEAPLPEPEAIHTDDPETLSLLAEITALAEEHGLSVSYLSGDGMHSFSVNGGEARPSASTIKAMYCEYLLESGVDWQEKLLFDMEVTMDSSSGALTEEKLGSLFTVGELIDYALRNSDNMAYALLYAAFGKENYNAWVVELGLPGLQIFSESGYTVVSADDLSRGMLEIYRYSRADGRVVSPLRHARFRSRLSAGIPHAVACKFGLKSDRTGYHETAIVYAPAPYMLTVMSCLNPDEPGEALPFIEAAKLVDRLNQRLYPYEL